MNAQSFDAKLSIEKVTKDNRAATVRIGLSGRISGQHVLNVYLIKVEGRWKVDDVKAVEEFSLAERPERSGFKTKASVAPVCDRRRDIPDIAATNRRYRRSRHARSGARYRSQTPFEFLTCDLGIPPIFN